MKPKKLFNCSYEVLYTVCLMALDYCRANLAKFSAFKSLYTEGYIDAATDAVNKAKELSTVEERNAQCKKIRENLEAAAVVVLDNFQQLKCYIKTAFEGPQEKTNLQEAGATFYDKSSGQNWSALRSLMEAANKYIAANIDALLKKNNMPAEFPKIFADNSAACLKLSKDFMKAEVSKDTGATDKNDASNDVYKTLMDMLTDGQRIFVKDPAIKKQFVFVNLKKLAKGQSPASFKGYIYYGKKLGLKGATVKSSDGSYIGVTDKAGRFMITQMKSGTYIFIITADNYLPVEIEVTLKPGTAKHLNFTLVAASGEEAQNDTMSVA